LIAHGLNRDQVSPTSIYRKL